MNLEFINIRKSFEKAEFKPIYLFYGEESFYTSRLTDLIGSAAMTEAERSFNQFILYGADTNASQISDLLRQYPMMSKYRLVIVKDAHLLSPTPSFLDYLTKPLETSILVLYSDKNIDKRKKLYTSLKKTAVIFESKKLYDNQLPNWITRFVESQSAKITDGAVRALAQYVGTDLKQQAKTIERLMENGTDKGQIVEEDVFDNVGISRDFNVFELNKALGQRKFDQSLLISHQLMLDIKSNDPIWLISAIFGYFQKALIYQQNKGKDQKALLKLMSIGSSYFLQEYALISKHFNASSIISIFKLLSETDFKLKGMGQDQLSREEIFMQLVSKILVS